MSCGHRRVLDKSVFPVPPAQTSRRLSSGSSSSEGCRFRGGWSWSEVTGAVTGSQAARPRAQPAPPDCPSGCHPCRSRSSTGRSPGSSDPVGFPGQHRWEERTAQSGEGTRGRCKARGAGISPHQPLPRLLLPAPLQPSTPSSSRSLLHTSPEQEEGGGTPPSARGTHKAMLPGYLPMGRGLLRSRKALPQTRRALFKNRSLAGVQTSLSSCYLKTEMKDCGPWLVQKEQTR